MKKQRLLPILFFILSMTVVLIITIISCVLHTKEEMTAYSFQRLTEMTEDAASSFQSTIQTNFTLLDTMSNLIAAGNDIYGEQTLAVLDAFKYHEPYINVMLLTPDGILLDHDGSRYDVSDKADFEYEAGRGAHLSGRTDDFLKSGKQVIHQAVPVIQNGETVAVLCAILALKDVSDIYQVNDFGGNAFIMLVDGSNGDVLIDTWHDELGNLSDYLERDYHDGDTVAISMEKMARNEGGYMSFTSKTKGSNIYLRYEPIGYEHYSAVIGVLESIALEEPQAITENLYALAIFIFLVQFFCTAAVALFLMQVNRISNTDQNTGLLNRRAYDDYLSKNSKVHFRRAACIYLDANGLHELNNRCGHAAGDAMLNAVASEMRNHWPDSEMYRIGGDEFVIFPRKTDETLCREEIERFKSDIESQNYSVSAGFALREDDIGLENAVSDSDEDMLRNKADYYKEHTSDCRAARR